MKHELLTRQELADRFGVDVRTITRWVADGMPQRTKNGNPVYAWAECRAWWEAKIRADGRATREAGGDEERKQQLAAAKLRTVLAEAEEAELRLAQRRGELVTLDFMRGEFSRIAEAIRTRLLALPPAWAQRLGACTTTVDRQLALADAVNELMPILRELADDDGEDDVESEVPAGAGAGGEA